MSAPSVSSRPTITRRWNNALVTHPNSLNGSQQHRLLITCKHIDQLLKDIEQTLRVTESKGVFPSYDNDIADKDRKTIEAFMERLRKQLIDVLAGQALVPETPRISASHSIEVALTFIEVAIEELAPRYMRGYGTVSEQGVTDLNTIVTTLLSTAKEFHGYIERLAHSSD